MLFIDSESYVVCSFNMAYVKSEVRVVGKKRVYIVGHSFARHLRDHAALHQIADNGGMDPTKHSVKYICSARGKRLYKTDDFDDDAVHFIKERMGMYTHLAYLIIGTNDIATDPDNVEAHADAAIELARQLSSDYCCRFVGVLECYPRFGPGGFPNMDQNSDWEVVNENFRKKVVEFNTFLFEKIRALADKHVFFVPMRGFHDDPTEWLNEDGLHLTREGEAKLLVNLKRLSVNYCHNNRTENWRE